MYHDMDGWWMLWGGLMMLFFWGGVIALAIWAVRSLTDRQAPERDAPIEIARRRYAAGEITQQELEQIARDLSDGPIAHAGPPT
jgi:putative membrane protein